MRGTRLCRMQGPQAGTRVRGPRGTGLASPAWMLPILALLLAEPFAFADFTWLNGTARTRSSALETAAFTDELRLDASSIWRCS